jgi:hypothetical protein
MAPVVMPANDILRTRSGKKPSGLSGAASEEIKFAVIIIAVLSY